MYVRPQNFKYPSGMHIPENYSGNTFREPIVETDQAEKEIAEEIVKEPEQKTDATATSALLTPKEGFGLRIGSLFGDKGIGSEELLILALILLLADSEDGQDLILFLALLLFIK